MSMSVCLFHHTLNMSAMISSQLHVLSSPNFFVHVSYGCGSVLLWRRNDMLCASGLIFFVCS